MQKRLVALALAGWCLAVLNGCGGGGGGGAAPADVIGRLLLVGAGTPVADAAVSIAGVSFRTGASGTFTLRGVPSDAAQITVAAPGLSILNQALPPLTAGRTNDLGDLYLSPDGYTARVVGRVVRSDNLQPVSGARLRLSGQIATTGADGRFTLEKLPVGLGGPDPVGVITAAGFQDKLLVIDPPLGASPPDNVLGDVPISLPVGDRPDPPTNIRGTVTVSGAPDNAGVTVSLLTRPAGATVATVTTRPDGKFGFWAIAGAYTVRAEVVGRPAKTADVNLPSPDQVVTVNLTL